MASFPFASFSLSLVTLAASASVGSCRSAVSSWLRYRATLSSSWARRRSTFARVKFLSRLFTALNLLPSMATLDVARRPISRQSSTKRAQTLRSASPLFLRKSQNLFVTRHNPAQQPHDLDVASGLSFQPPARLHPVQIAVNVKLQENRGMVRPPASCRRLNSIEAHLGQIESIDKHIDHPHRVA